MSGRFQKVCLTKPKVFEPSCILATLARLISGAFHRLVNSISSEKFKLKSISTWEHLNLSFPTRSTATVELQSSPAKISDLNFQFCSLSLSAWRCAALETEAMFLHNYNLQSNGKIKRERIDGIPLMGIYRQSWLFVTFALAQYPLI